MQKVNLSLYSLLNILYTYNVQISAEIKCNNTCALDTLFITCELYLLLLKGNKL